MENTMEKLWEFLCVAYIFSCLSLALLALFELPEGQLCAGAEPWRGKRR